jgi:putative flippase GtrA
VTERAPRRRSFPRFFQWVRHHTASALGTAVDFATMIVCVEALHLSPVVATVIAATVGAVANFSLGRFWTYQGRGAALQPQFFRYALVAAASLGLNAAGEHLFADVLHVQYLLARVITAVVVSNAWNYPMQRFFVFGDRARGKASA